MNREHFKQLHIFINTIYIEKLQISIYVLAYQWISEEWLRLTSGLKVMRTLRPFPGLPIIENKGQFKIKAPKVFMHVHIYIYTYILNIGFYLKLYFIFHLDNCFITRYDSYETLIG